MKLVKDPTIIRIIQTEATFKRFLPKNELVPHLRRRQFLLDRHPKETQLPTQYRFKLRLLEMFLLTLPTIRHRARCHQVLLLLDIQLVNPCPTFLLRNQLNRDIRNTLGRTLDLVLILLPLTHHHHLMHNNNLRLHRHRHPITQVLHRKHKLRQKRPRVIPSTRAKWNEYEQCLHLN